MFNLPQKEIQTLYQTTALRTPSPQHSDNRPMNFDDFFLHPLCDRMKDVDVYNYSYVAFDEPEVALYDKPDGAQLTRLRIAVYSTDGDATILGYLPLPLRYWKHWKQLCYTIVYHKCLHNSLKLLEREGGFKLARSCALSASAILKYQIYCRGKIIEEIFSLQGSQFHTLPTFDEYIIKERWDLHWIDPADMILGRTQGIQFLGRSPFDSDVVNALGKNLDSFISPLSSL
jgi:hypothetical protein